MKVIFIVFFIAWNVVKTHGRFVDVLTPNHGYYLSSFEAFSFIPVNESEVDSFTLILSWMALRAPSTLASSPPKNLRSPSLMASLFILPLRTDLRMAIFPFLRLMVSIPWPTIWLFTVSFRRFSSWVRILISDFASESCFESSTSLATLSESSLGTDIIYIKLRSNLYAKLAQRTHHTV